MNAAFLTPVVLVAASFASAQAQPGEAEGAFAALNFDQARAAAQKENKLLMIDFFTTWCGPCKKLDAMTWPDPRVQRWLLENVIAIKIDADKDTRTKSVYEVNLYPSIVFLTPEGLELTRLEGFVDADRFLGSSRMAIGAAQNGNELALRATAAEAEVPETRLAYANFLAGTGRNRDAGSHYLWCFDEGAKHDANFASKRRGEVLDNLAWISRTWLQGKSAMRERRAAALERLKSDAGTGEDALDLVALDKKLLNTADTLKVYLELAAGSDRQKKSAAAMLEGVFESLIGPRRYADIAACAPDFEAALRKRFAEHQALAASFANNPRAESMLSAERTAIVTRGTLWVEALLAVDQAEAAHALAERLVEKDPTARTYLGIARRAKRAGKPDAALRWVEAGLAKLPKSQHTSLTIMKKSLERELDAAKQ